MEQVINNDRPPLINIGSGQEVTISELASRVAKKVNYSGEIGWNSDMPDGTPRKLLDSSIMQSLGWRPKVSLDQGLALVCHEYLQSLKGAGVEG